MNDMMHAMIDITLGQPALFDFKYMTKGSGVRIPRPPFCLQAGCHLPDYSWGSPHGRGEALI